MSVTVICPNRHRVNVKVGPGTTLFQVLDEACKRQGFITDKFALRHHSNIIDLSLTFRLSGLPQNCDLEVVDCVGKGNQELEIALQLPDGKRLTTTIPADATLIDMLLDFENFSGIKLLEDEEMQPVCSYLNHEYIGVSSLTATKLKSLGIRDRALFRYTRRKISKEKMLEINQSVEQDNAKQKKLDEVFVKKFQTNQNEEKIEEKRQKSINSRAESRPVSTKLAASDIDRRSASSGTDEETVLINKLAGAADFNNVSATVSPNVLASGSTRPGSVDQSTSISPMVTSSGSRGSSVGRSPLDKNPPVQPQSGPSRLEMLQRMLSDVDGSIVDSSSSNRSQTNASNSSVNSRRKSGPVVVDFSNFKFPENTKGIDLRDKTTEAPLNLEPCDRRPVVYRIDDALNIGVVEPPPEFYDVSVEDVRLQLRLLREQNMAFGQLSAVSESFVRERDLQEKRKVWKFSVIRIQFVDGTILQGTFRSLEKMAALYHFVQMHLNNDKIAFDLVAAPNVRLHKMDENFIDAGIAPRSLLIFKCRKEDSEALNACLAKLAQGPCRKSQAEAELTAHECLLQNDRFVPYTAAPSNLNDRPEPQAASSRDYNRPASGATTSKPNSQCPKWLKR